MVTETAAALDPEAVVDTYVRRTLEERPSLAAALGRPVPEPPPVDRIVARARVYLETLDALPLDGVDPRVREGIDRTRLDALRTLRTHAPAVVALRPAERMRVENNWDARFAAFVRYWLTGT